MPSITISSRTASHSDDKGLRIARDTSDHTSGLAPVPVAASSDMQALQSHASSSEHYCEHVTAGCEGVVHTVAVHYAHAPTEDVTTKFVHILFIFKN